MEVILDSIENNKDEENIVNIIQQQLLEQGYDVDIFSFEIKVFFKSWRNRESKEELKHKMNLKSYFNAKGGD